MKSFSFIACIFVLTISAWASGTDDLLQYDDGIADWFTFEGEYRGTWFNLEDFYPSLDATGFVLNYAEVWFFHVMNSNQEWDTSDFIGEITDGTPYSTGTIFAHDTGTAAHLSPSYIYPIAPCTTSMNFTVTEIPQFSRIGAPSIASDISPAAKPRSFTVTTPGVIDFWQYDFLIRVNGYPVPPVEFSRTTWASLKATFDCIR
ncbi:MAG: hypothetical protein KAR40_01060 [Candidatus Sabulitectum sp.]|nr:hypothetical protein [Candidatus Sabulitectum sp.]